MSFRSIVAKPKTLIDKEIDSIHIVGQELNYFDASKIQRKPLFDRDVVTHQSNLEPLLDHCFTQLGVTEAISQPVVLTETLCNPNKSRALVNELMFECYQVPELSIVNDAMAAYYHQTSSQSRGGLPDGLIIHSGHHSTSIIVVLDGQMQLDNTRRIPIGGN